MANRKNLRSAFGRGIGAASSDTSVTLYHDNGDGTFDEAVGAHNYVWDGSQWVKATAAAGGGGAATVADGADVAQGTTSDAAWSSGNGTVISLLKKIASAGGSAVSIADGSDVAQGTTTDLSSANTVIGILKAIKAAVTGTLTVGSHPVTNAGTFAVQAAATLAAETTKVIGTINISSSQTVGLAAGSQVIGHVILDSGTLTTLTGITNVVHIDDNASSVTVDAPVGTPVFATLTPNATGGWAVNSQTGLTNTKVAVKASAGTFGGYMIYNPNAVVAHVQIWDVASGSVTVGTTVPTYVLSIPATSAANLEFTNGVNHATAITLAATTTPTGSTAPGTALVAAFFYK